MCCTLISQRFCQQQIGPKQVGDPCCGEHAIHGPAITPAERNRLKRCAQHLAMRLKTIHDHQPEALAKLCSKRQNCQTCSGRFQKSRLAC